MTNPIDFERTKISYATTRAAYGASSALSFEHFLEHLPKIAGFGSIEHVLPRDFGTVQAEVWFDLRMVDDGRWSASIRRRGVIWFAPPGGSFASFFYRAPGSMEKGDSTFFFTETGSAGEDRHAVFLRVFDRMITLLEDMTVRAPPPPPKVIYMETRTAEGRPIAELDRRECVKLPTPAEVETWLHECGWMPVDRDDAWKRSVRGISVVEIDPTYDPVKPIHMSRHRLFAKPMNRAEKAAVAARSAS